MKVRKRDGLIADFNKVKISDAIIKAMNESNHVNKDVANRIANEISKLQYNIIEIETIQDIVEEKLMASSFKDVARAYITYRNERTEKRGNPLDKVVEEIVAGENEYWAKENSNKNPILVPVQRDYIAGAYSTDLTRRKLLPKDIVEAHDEGIIHFHDADYFAQNALTNCELLNLEDMLQNGTVINGVKIDKPHRLITATTIATQIILAVTSSTYGGCTVSLAHLAPFVLDSFKRYWIEYIGLVLQDPELADTFANHTDGFWDSKLKMNSDLLTKNSYAYDYALFKTRKEIKDSVQTFNYQVNSMTNTNGQAPFLSVCMYLGETEEYKEELAMLIEEFLNQRILGFKNKQEVYVTPAFPKLLYILEEDNIHEGSKYYYLTELAAKCTAKRMVPDYISEKLMKQLKIDANGNGQCYPCINKFCA